ncbi:MAG: site-specific integrase, partial [Defluviitaleaceae bacterium]|nr:site-specific integrase [Defluviitaleaceae bacterium]
MKQTLFIRQLSAYFETHLPDVRHCSQNTISSYADAFALLFQFMQEKKGIAHNRLDYKIFTPPVVEEFTLWLVHERSYSTASVKQRLSALNSFMKYASRREMAALAAYTVVAGAEKPKVHTPPFPYFTLEEMRILLRLPKPDRKIEKRDMVLLSLFYDSAARAQELCNLKVGDIRFGATTKVKLVGKGNKAREVPISSDVSMLLHYHLKENGIVDVRDHPLFSSQLGGKMTTACIRNLVSKYVARAKDAHPNIFSEPKYSPHSFRHSKAVHMVESGTQLIYIRNFLGHVSVQSTEVYARIGQGALMRMLSDR